MSTPAGWYPDPQDQAQLRYWDGAQWTEHRAPAVAETPQAQTAPRPQAAAAQPAAAASTATAVSPWPIAVVAGALVLVVSTFLPWAGAGSVTVDAFDKNLPWFLTGLDVDSFEEGSLAHGGLFVLFAVVAAGGGALAFVGQRQPGFLIATIAGAVSTLLVLIDWQRFNSEFGPGVSVEYGLFLALVGSVVVAAAGIVGLLGAKDQA